MPKPGRNDPCPCGSGRKFKKCCLFKGGNGERTACSDRPVLNADGGLDEVRLIEKLRAIEALFFGATTNGEREAAGRAKERIAARLRELETDSPPVEYKFTMGDVWNRRVFLALLRRYGLRPYRYRGQRHTTVMVRVSKRFVDETLWPEFKKFSETLEAYLNEVTERVVSQVLGDGSEATVVDRPSQQMLIAPE